MFTVLGCAKSIISGREQLSRLFCLLLLLVLPVSTAWSANTVKYNSLRVGENSGVVKVVLDLGGPSKVKYFSLPNPNRFVVDVLDVVRTGDKPELDLKNTPIKNIRTGIRKGDDLRMVIDLSQKVEGRAYVLKPDHGKGHRLVVELSGSFDVPTKKESAPVVVKTPVIVKKESSPTAVKPEVVVPVSAASAKKVEAVSISKIEVQTQSEPQVQPKVKKKEVALDQPARDIIIAIDAGHGGADVGAIGYKDTREKDVVLRIARKLEHLIEKEPGMRPLMIRDGDYFVSLRNRIKKARTYKADMFVSIHADAFPDERAKGSSVYALSQHGATTEAARFLADSENASDLIGGVTLDDKDEMLASVLLDLSQNATIEASLDVGSRVLGGLKRVGKVHKNRVEQAGFAVLKSPDIPSILVETAFISNPKEEKKLNTPAYQQQLAKAVLKGIRSYFISNPPPGTRIAAREHVIKRGDTLSGIAQHYNISLKSLRTTNQLSSDVVRVGQVLQIPTSDG